MGAVMDVLVHDLLAQAAPVQSNVLWIALAVVLALLIVALVVGLLVSRRRRVSLGEKDRPESGTPREGYRSSGQISFSAGGGADTLDRPRPAPGAEPGPPAEPSPAPGARPAEAPGAADAAGPPATSPAVPPATTPAVPPATTSIVPPATTPAVPPATTSIVPPATTPAVPPATTSIVPPATSPASGEPTSATWTSDQIAEIEPSERRLERLRGRLAGSRSAFGQSMLGLLGGGDLDEDSWEQVEDTLLLADIGSQTTNELVTVLRKEVAGQAVRTPGEARELLRKVLTEALSPELDRAVRALPHDGRPAVLLVAGVNGTGKTTTTGKLARVLVAQGRTVVLGAADTFRAAAAEQLVTWGERSGATVVRGAEGADPASVAFEAVKRATEQKADAVLLDTAGRLHTKTGLMDELGKIKRVVSRHGEVDEVLLVLDATTGQNGVLQARVFSEVIDVTGIVLTKLDGTAKGGIVFRVQRELGVPVKLVGLGEGPDDLAPFEPAAFVDALLR
jgi:fused signal recognition particle receptor